MATTSGFHTKTEWIYAQLRGLIGGGELGPGERLPLGPLAERFGTSEIPVREALRMLQRDGLVDMESHRGARVASVSWEELYEAIVIRTHLEELAAREAAPCHTRSSIAGLKELLGRMDDLAGSPSPESADGFSRANREFHARLYEPGPYPHLIALVEELWDRAWRTRSQTLFYVERDRMLRGQADHRAIVDAIDSGDLERVGQIASEHRALELRAWREIIDRATVRVGRERTDSATGAA